MYIEVDKIGNLLEELIDKNDSITVTKLADKLKVSRQAIYKWINEENKLSTETLSVILNVMGESVLMEKGKYKILKEKNMNNTELVLDFTNFNVDDVLKEYEENLMNKAIYLSDKSFDLCRDLEDKGFELIFSMSWNHSYWRKEFCYEGDIISIEKDNKSMSIVIDKASSLELFDIDEFVKDISEKYGNGVGDYIKKSIFFMCYHLNMGDDIFNCFKKNKNINTIVHLIPLIKDFGEIVHAQLKDKDTYFKELESITFHEKYPLPISLGLCDEFSDDYIWIKMINEDEEERFLEDSFESPYIADALEYIKDNFDNFDKLFDKAIK